MVGGSYLEWAHLIIRRDTSIGREKILQAAHRRSIRILVEWGWGGAVAVVGVWRGGGLFGAREFTL